MDVTQCVAAFHQCEKYLFILGELNVLSFLSSLSSLSN